MNMHAAPSIFCSVLLIFLGGAVFFLNRTRTNFIFFLLTLSASIWQLGTACTITASNPSSAYFWTKFSYIGVSFITVTMFHFVVEFLDMKNTLKYVPIAYLIAIFMFIPLSWTSLFLDGVYQFNWGYWFKATMFHPFYILAYSSLFFLNILFLYKAYKQKTGIKKEKTAYLLLALLISYGGAVDYLTDYGINIYPIGYIFVVICLIIIAFAITKKELMDIKLIINRSAARLLTNGIFISFFLLFIYGYAMGRNQPIDWILIGLLILIGIFVGETYHILRQKIQTGAVNKWISDFYDSESVFDAVSEQVFLSLENKEILRLVTKELKTKITLTQAFFGLCHQTDRGIDSLAFDVYDLDNQLIQIDMAKNIEFFQNCTEPILVSEIPDEMRSKIQILVKKDDGLVCPISSSNHLIGVIILGQKVSEAEFGNKDIQLMKRIKVLLKAVLDRNQPFEEIKAKYEKSLEFAETVSKQTTLATMINGIAHELRNPFAMMGRSVIEIEKIKQDPVKLEKYIRSQNDNINRCNVILEQMINYGQSGTITMTKKLASVNTIIEEVIRLSEVTLREHHIQLKPNLNPVPDILIDDVGIYQVILNMLTNAIQAIGDNGIMTITTQLDRFVRQMVECDGVSIQIEDTGCGIPEEVLRHIYEPFFTTKYSAGTTQHLGLGLSICSKIIAEHDGLIEAESQASKGSRFKFYLPRT